MYTAIKRKKLMIWLLSISAKDSKAIQRGHWGVTAVRWPPAVFDIEFLYHSRVSLHSSQSECYDRNCIFVYFEMAFDIASVSSDVLLYFLCGIHFLYMYLFFLLFIVFLNRMHLCYTNFCLVYFGYLFTFHLFLFNRLYSIL